MSWWMNCHSIKYDNNRFWPIPVCEDVSNIKDLHHPPTHQAPGGTSRIRSELSDSMRWANTMFEKDELRTMQCGAPVYDSYVGEHNSNNYGLWYANHYYILVGGFNMFQPFWKMMEFVSWDYDIPNWMVSQKVRHNPLYIHVPVTTN